MSKRIKPKAEHRIVDGEVMTAEIDEKIKRGREYSKQKSEGVLDDGPKIDDTSSEQDPDSILKDVDPNSTLVDEMPKTNVFKRNSKLFISLILFTVLIAVIWYSRPNLDWQVEKINDLQREVSLLQEQNQVIQAQLQEQQIAQDELIENKLKEALKNSTANIVSAATESMSAVDETQLSALKEEFTNQLENLKMQLSAASNTAGEDVSSALSEINKQAAELLPQATEKLQNLEQDMQSKFGEFSQELSELLAFKEEQQAAKPVTDSTQHSPLSSLQIQQWIIEINTQWMLNGRYQETKQQLFALEQAASLSDLTFTSQLARLIGQDLSYLQQVEATLSDNKKVSTQSLKQAIQSLSFDDMAKQKEQVDNSEEITEAGEGSDSLNALVNKFSQLISVKKREDGDSLGEVNKLLLNDVLKQRMALLVDRLDWGLATHSKNIVDQSITELQAFIKHYYPNRSAEFSGLFAPFSEVEFFTKSPLSITQLDEYVTP